MAGVSTVQPFRWLFFDLGSTLIDETQVYRRRMEDMARASGLSVQEIFDAEVSLYRRNLLGEKELVRQLGLPKPTWYFEDERLYPDAIEVLSLLHQDYSIGILANQKAGAGERLQQMGIAEHIDLLISSGEEGAAKPDPRIFQIALDRAGCRPEEAAMIGDRLDNDIAPAKALGMYTIWIRQGFGGLWTPDRPEYVPDETVGSLMELAGRYGGLGRE